MLRSIRAYRGASIHASDGAVGSAVEFLFDDHHWTIRYLVVNAGTWLFGRKVLISPIAICGQNWENKAINVNLTRDQVKDSPDVDTDKPVSRQWETDNADYYGWPYYWGGLGFGGMGGSGIGLWGGGYYPGALAEIPNLESERALQQKAAAEQSQFDPNLRSTEEVTGYHIQASDGSLGHVSDFMVDAETWTIRYLVIDTQNWWPGKQVLLPPEWISDINWSDRSVSTELTRDAVRSAPAWDVDVAVTREYEEQLHAHYGRPGYWHGRSLTAPLP